jgi:hypothetical protein
VGFLGILDAAGAVSVPAPAYFAAALATIGAGLMIGSLFGRVRGPIFLGILLLIGLIATSTANSYRGSNTEIRPATLAGLPADLTGHAGRIIVDAREINFANQSRAMDLHLSFGHIVVRVPPNVDVHVVSKVGVGDVVAFGRNSSGVHAHADVTDYGADGQGGGELDITATIAAAGQVEVTR